MVFYGFAAVVAVVAFLGFIRSPVVRQLRRGHAADQAQFPSRKDNAIYAKSLFRDRDPKPPKWD